MASFRDLVSGGGACAVPEASSSSSSNPLGALANTLLGSSSKTQEKLRELPAQTTTGPILSVTGEDGLTSLPGSEIDKLQYPDAQSSEFLQSYYAAENGNLSDVWDGIERVTPYPGPHVGLRPLHNDRLENIYGSESPFPQPMWEGPPQNVVSHVLHSFWDSIRAGIPFQPVALPTLGLSSADKQCIIDRTAIMSRHIFADKSDEYIDSQVNALLHSLDIDNDLRGKVHERGRYPELEEYWTESQGASNLVTSHTANRWVDEFDQSRPPVDPGSWADTFEQQHGVSGWVSQYQQEQQMESAARLRGTNIPNLAAMEHSRLLVETLAQNEDPRFQHSKFLQFVSKMSRGELIIDDNQVKPLELSSNWAEEYHQQYDRNPETWANQYTNGQSTSDAWAGEFASEHDRHTIQEDQWANEFSKLNMQGWADEFSSQFAEGAFDSSADNWVDSYEKFLEKELTAGQQRSDSSRSMYVFADQNPYVGHSNPLKVGQELFRKGLLSEAVLALEAEVLKNPENAEGWRLLGITHAENDDDQQAISSMMHAMEVDPNNLEVLLALGVSYTNGLIRWHCNSSRIPLREGLDVPKLEQSAALKYLYKWLQNHPKYGALIPPEQMAQLHYDDVSRLFNEAVQLSPDDADIHIVLGVMYNISRQYDKAIASFQKALKLKPRDYSLWNKLGATQANSVQSSDAIDAYQRALDLKPNYVRAWANMGISFANQGRYEESISYYVRALSMNPKADNTWEYLRISLSCASREDLLEACSSRNLELLQKQFPL